MLIDVVMGGKALGLWSFQYALSDALRKTGSWRGEVVG